MLVVLGCLTIDIEKIRVTLTTISSTATTTGKKAIIPHSLFLQDTTHDSADVTNSIGQIDKTIKYYLG